MARPTKQGLDYFPMDVTTDDKFELIEAKHGITGFGIVVKLFQKIYKEGCYLEWSEEKLLIFKKNINVDINTINEVINDCLCYEIFDKNIHKKYSILTSSGIQKRFFAACDRRKNVELNKKYIIVDINEVNVNINWINDCKSTQSKVKESKEEKSKVNNEVEIPLCLQNDIFIEKWNTLLTLKKWKSKPFSAIQQSIESLSRFDVEFSIKLIETAISGNNQGIVFPNTIESYQKWIKQRQNDFDNMTPEQKDGYRQKIISDFYSDEKWINSTALYLGVDLITFKRRLLSFLEKLKATDGIYKPAKDIKEHFVNWHNKQTEKQSA